MTVPTAMKNIAVRSYYQINFSPSISVDRIRFAMMAVALLQEISARSICGRIAAYVTLLAITKIIPIIHFQEQ